MSNISVDLEPARVRSTCSSSSSSAAADAPSSPSSLAMQKHCCGTASTVETLDFTVTQCASSDRVVAASPPSSSPGGARSHLQLSDFAPQCPTSRAASTTYSPAPAPYAISKTLANSSRHRSAASGASRFNCLMAYPQREQNLRIAAMSLASISTSRPTSGPARPLGGPARPTDGRAVSHSIT